LQTFHLRSRPSTGGNDFMYAAIAARSLSGSAHDLAHCAPQCIAIRQIVGLKDSRSRRAFV